MKPWIAALLGGAGALLAFLMSMAVGHAQLAVECINCHSEITDTLRWIQQAKDMVNSLERLKQQYEAIAHLPQNIIGMGNQLVTKPTLQNPLPQADAIQRFARGYDLADGAYNLKTQNFYYEAKGEDFNAAELMRRAKTTANFQAMAQQSLTSIEERQQSLTEFYGSIEESPDIQQSAAIQARLQLEQNFVAGQQAQAQQLVAMVNLANRVDTIRAEEKHRKDAEEAIEQAGGVAGALIN